MINWIQRQPAWLWPYLIATALCLAGTVSHGAYTILGLALYLLIIFRKVYDTLYKMIQKGSHDV
jgi:hypothetical protein